MIYYSKNKKKSCIPGDRKMQDFQREKTLLISVLTKVKPDLI